MRPALFLAGLFVLAYGLSGCEEKKPADPRPATQTKTKIKINPMLFLEIQQEEITKIIKAHWSDCEGGLVALLRFIDAQKPAFQDKYKDKPANWRPSQGPGPRKIKSLLMQWSKRCPKQIPRINQALQSIQY